jgi:hypothetical protein
MTKINAFSARGKQLIEHLAFSGHGRSTKLKSMLDSFKKEPDEKKLGENELAILIEDLRSYLAERLPKATVQETRFFAQKASCAQGNKELGSIISITIRAYQVRQEKLASGEDQGSSSDPASSPDDGEHKDGPGNPSPRKIKGGNDPR